MSLIDQVKHRMMRNVMKGLSFWDWLFKFELFTGFACKEANINMTTEWLQLQSFPQISNSSSTRTILIPSANTACFHIPTSLIFSWPHRLCGAGLTCLPGYNTLTEFYCQSRYVLPGVAVSMVPTGEFCCCKHTYFKQKLQKTKSHIHERTHPLNS